MVLAATAIAASEKCPQYGRIQIDLPAGAARVEITAPNGFVATPLVFTHQPVRFTYDAHGWETMAADGAARLAVRYTPVEPGVHRWRAMNADGGALAEGEIVCDASRHPGYVEISRQDPRYFATSNGASFCAIGLNLCTMPSYDLPAGGEFKTSGQRGLLGVREYDRWFARLGANGGNFVRLWCGASYLDFQKQELGEIDPVLIGRLDAVVASARARGIRLKLCIDTFRTVGSGSFFARVLKDPQSGESPKDMSEFLDSPRWRELWLQKARHLAARYAGDPTVAVIEPWNEMNCVAAPWEKTLAWNAYMLPELKKLFPRQLVVNSLGSFDGDWCVQHHEDMQKLASQEFDQVHRYLDQGSRYEVCHDPVAGSVEAIRRVGQAKRPVLLAETGAVNNNHTGLFRFARWDDRGIIFHDTTFPAFFAGSAGTGQNWFWDSYVDQKNLWGQFKALADLVDGVALDRQQFTSTDLSTPSAWCIALVGRSQTLVWLRHRGDTWQASLMNQQNIRPLRDLRLELPRAGTLAKATSTWTEETGALRVEGSTLVVPELRAGMMIRIDHGR